MDKHKKNKTIEWTAYIICLIGFMLLIATLFVETEYNLSTIGIASISIGLLLYLVFGNKINK